MNKQPLNVSVVLDLIRQVLENTQSFMQTAQEADMQYGNDVVEVLPIMELLEKYKKQKLLYGTEINGKTYYNFEKELEINLKGDFTPYDVIDIALALLLTQNKANLYVKKVNQSYSLDLVLNLLIKFAESLKVNADYIKLKNVPSKGKQKFDFEFTKVEEKILYKRKTLEIEFDYNLLLNAYEEESKSEEGGGESEK